MEQKNELDNFEKKFTKLIAENQLNINSIEELIIAETEEYKKQLENKVENLLRQNVKEKELINKKNKNGKKKDLN